MKTITIRVKVGGGGVGGGGRSHSSAFVPSTKDCNINKKRKIIEMALASPGFLSGCLK